MDFLAELRTRTLIFDGAMGTQLIAAGYRPVESPESWTITNPDVVAGIHRAYLEAGADIIETNTFGGSRSKLSAYRAGDQVGELARRHYSGCCRLRIAHRQARGYAA